MTMLLESLKNSALSKTSLPRRQFQELLILLYGKASMAANVVLLSLLKTAPIKFLDRRAFSSRLLYETFRLKQRLNIGYDRYDTCVQDVLDNNFFSFIFWS